jgi:hypothetical protein
MSSASFIGALALGPVLPLADIKPFVSSGKILFSESLLNDDGAGYLLINGYHILEGFDEMLINGSLKGNLPEFENIIPEIEPDADIYAA